jgi:ribose 5-phosphate isomerase B
MRIMGVQRTQENTVRIAMGADHGGFDMKNELAAHLRTSGHDVVDLGAHAYDAADDYPDFARPVAEAIANGEAERGIVVCGSGVGASIAANKIRGVRAALCHDTYSARQGVEHDDMNVLCLGARVIGVELARELVAAFVGARFSGEERHLRRLNKMLAIERNATRA